MPDSESGLACSAPNVEIRVHLVAHEPQVVPAADLADRGDLARRHHRARRVVRRREQHGPGARRDGALDVVRLEMEPSLGQQRDVDDPRARRSQHRLVGDVGGLGDDDLVPRVEDALADGVQRGLGAGEVHDALARDRGTGELADVTGDRLAQALESGRRHVARVTGAQRPDSLLDDRRGRTDVALADAQQDDVVALLAAALREIVDGPGVRTGTANAISQRRVAHDLTVPAGAGRTQWMASTHPAASRARRTSTVAR